MRRPLMPTTLAVLAGSLAVVVAAGVPAQAAAPSISGAGVTAQDTAVGTYYPITKDQRLLDTRSTLGGHQGPLGPRAELALQVGGRAGIPAGNAASAVVLNVTGVLPTAATYLTAYPSGTTRPGVSILNMAPKAIRSNMVTVPVGADGKVRLYNNAGSVNVVVDVMGFYAGTDIQSTYNIGSMYYVDSNPSRLFDSRTDGGALAPGEGVDLGVDYGDAENLNVRAFAVNITAIAPSTAGYLVAWDGIGGAPRASSVNFIKGQILPNMAVVPASKDADGVPKFTVANGPNATTHVAVDIVGVYVANETQGLRFVPLTPSRIVDTRSGVGGFKGAIGPKVVKKFTAPPSVAADPTFAIVSNATAIAPTASTFVTIFEDGQARPAVSNLNAATGEITANAAVLPLGPGNVFDIFNNLGNINIALDVAGRFDAYTAPAAAPGVTAQSTSPVKATAPEVRAAKVSRR